MSIEAWTEEANKLIDAAAKADAEIRRLNAVAAKHRSEIRKAEERAFRANSELEVFISACVKVRADVYEVDISK